MRLDQSRNAIAGVLNAARLAAALQKPVSPQAMAVAAKRPSLRRRLRARVAALKEHLVRRNTVAAPGKRPSLHKRLRAMAAAPFRFVLRPIVRPIRKSIIRYLDESWGKKTSEWTERIATAETRLVGLHEKVDYVGLQGASVSSAVSATQEMLGRVVDQLAVNKDEINGAVRLLTVSGKRTDQALESQRGGLDRAVDLIAANIAANKEKTDGAIALLTATSDHARQLMTGLHEKLDRHGQTLEAQALAALARLELLTSRQVVPLDGGRLLALRNPDGHIVAPSRDLAQAIYLGQGELPEPGTRAVVRHFLSEGGTLVDVGANLGLFTLVGGRTVGPKGRVIAIEPTPETADCLRQTIWINGLSQQAEIHQVAAGRRDGSMRLHIGATSSWNSLLDQGGGDSIEVLVRTVDSLVGDRPVQVVKIDVEGWELAVLEGMSALIARSPDLIVILEYGIEHIVRAGVTPEAWLAAATKNGFSAYAINEANGMLGKFDPHGTSPSVNVLLGRNMEARAPVLFK
jgi:FkbM family methyltransferase